MSSCKKEQGITLVALIVTVVVLLLISVILIRQASTSANDVRLKGFYTNLELIEKQVDIIATTNEKTEVEGEFVAIQELGTAYADLSTEKKEFLTTAIQDTDYSATNFRYFTKEEVINYIIDLNDFDDNLFINFAQRCVIAEKGIKLGSNEYHMQENKMYYVQQNTSKNVGSITSLSYTAIPYGTNTYKVTVTPSNMVGDIQGQGSIKYKKTTTQYWETSSDMTMIIEPGVAYNLIYTDSTGQNNIEKTIIGQANNNSLPNQYQQVEYIESTGTQYIDTGVTQKDSVNTTIEMQYEYTDTTISNYLFGMHAIGSEYAIYTGFYSEPSNLNKANNYKIGTNSINDIIKVKTTSNESKIINYEIYKNNVLIKQDENIDMKYDGRTDVNIYMFAMSKIWWEDAKYSKAKISMCKIYNSEDTLIRNFIPCYQKSNNAIGMYDTVNNVFYTNVGTGTFSKGQDVIGIEI